MRSSTIRLLKTANKQLKESSQCVSYPVAIYSSQPRQEPTTLKSTYAKCSNSKRRKKRAETRQFSKNSKRISQTIRLKHSWWTRTMEKKSTFTPFPFQSQNLILKQQFLIQKRDSIIAQSAKIEGLHMKKANFLSNSLIFANNLLCNI